MADRQYELVYILPADTTEEQVAALHEQVASVVSRMGGQFDKTENWGRRKLAYEIQHKTDGAYHLLTFSAEPETLEEVSRVLKITDGVMRHMAVRRSERRPGGTVASPPADRQDGADSSAPVAAQEEE
jgi:small subunit ribosomal protein S6